MKNWYRISKREYGKTLPEMGYKDEFVYIYRAVRFNVTTINNMDYVTRSKKFAIEHAEHMAVCTEEDQVVIYSMVYSKDVAEAYNPGEYFYIGNIPVNGRVIYEAKYETI